MKNSPKNPEDYIRPLHINGLDGRVLHMPAPNKTHKREILFVYGLRPTLERWWGLTQFFNKYGAVTMPDLPGFGGMDSFYKIGKTPDLDAMADYLTTFIKMRYSRRRISIVALSYGFVVVTRMLQRNPELAKRVDIIVSIAGFCHTDDFKYSPRMARFISTAARLVASRPVSYAYRLIVIRSGLLRFYYRYGGNPKFKHVAPHEFEDTLQAEYMLWRVNETRTYFYTLHVINSLDNCRKRIGVPVVHVSITSDQYFDRRLVEQHMRVIFEDFSESEAVLKVHAPTMMTDPEVAAALIPTAVRRALS